MTVRVTYSHNNSGGFDWITTDDYANLRDAGWGDAVEGEHGDFGKSGFASLDDGIEEWERITGGYARALGCTCCGPPHSLSAYDDETGDYVGSNSYDYDDYDGYDDYYDDGDYDAYNYEDYSDSFEYDAETGVEIEADYE